MDEARSTGTPALSGNGDEERTFVPCAAMRSSGWA
jgi:hypothetical protein